MSAVERVGPYVIVRALGHGAMGTVFEARDERSGRTVALKLLRALDPELLERFRREMQLAASVRHPHVTAVLDAGVHGRVPFIAFEVVPGGSLAARLKREGRLEWHEAARIAREIASALEAIHAAGLVHRDLKPENVLLDASARVKVSDFGLARPAGRKSDLTGTGETVGTPAYLSPEQARGDAEIDARADLYALGVLLFEALTGERPFQRQGFALLEAHLLEPPPSPRALAPEIPPELEALVLRLLAKEPAARPPSAREVARELAALERSAHGRRRDTSRLPSLFVTSGLLCIVAVIGVALAVSHGRAGPAATPAPSPGSSATPARPPRSKGTPSPRPSAPPAPSPTPTPPPPRVRPPWATIPPEAEKARRAAEALIWKARALPKNDDVHRTQVLDEAIRALDAILTSYPDDIGSHLLRASAYRLEDQLEAACKGCQRVIDVDPTLPEGHFWKGDVLREMAEDADVPGLDPAERRMLLESADAELSRAAECIMQGDSLWIAGSIAARRAKVLFLLGRNEQAWKQVEIAEQELASSRAPNIRVEIDEAKGAASRAR